MRSTLTYLLAVTFTFIAATPVQETTVTPFDAVASRLSEPNKIVESVLGAGPDGLTTYLAEELFTYTFTVTSNPTSTQFSTATSTNTLTIAEDASREVIKETGSGGPVTVAATCSVTASGQGECVGFVVDGNGSALPPWTASRETILPITTLTLTPEAAATDASGEAGQSKRPSSGVEGYLSPALGLYGVGISLVVSVSTGLFM